MRRQCCLPMTENPEASVLTAKRAPQHIRLSRANDAYEHLCILTLLPSLAPLHLMLADTPWPHGCGATLTNVGPLSEGFERSVASPLQPRRLRAMGTHSPINFLLVRQSFQQLSGRSPVCPSSARRARIRGNFLNFVFHCSAGNPILFTIA